MWDAQGTGDTTKSPDSLDLAIVGQGAETPHTIGVSRLAGFRSSWAILARFRHNNALACRVQTRALLVRSWTSQPSMTREVHDATLSSQGGYPAGAGYGPGRRGDETPTG